MTTPDAKGRRASKPEHEEGRRADGRSAGDLRPIRFVPGFLPNAEGSCLVSFGGTEVLCAVTFGAGAPAWRRGSGKGWLTAEYNMLPRSGAERVPRSNQTGGRSQEIQRLIGRTLRSVADLEGLGENTITVDCDVLKADGGTRTASITGSIVALRQAEGVLRARNLIAAPFVRELVAAVSVALVDGRPLLDPDYAEDSRAVVDLNLVMTEGGAIVEVQAGAEGATFSQAELGSLVRLGTRGVRRLIQHQRTALGRLDAR
jgi:ribonuclease PH